MRLTKARKEMVHLMLPQTQSLLDKVITKDVFDSISVIANNVNESLKSLSPHSSHRGRKTKYSNEFKLYLHINIPMPFYLP